jgi:hypothetical protein
VSCTTRPVTQTADVEVNRASEKGVTTPSAELSGSVRRKVPARIMARKLPMIIWNEDTLNE